MQLAGPLFALEMTNSREIRARLRPLSACFLNILVETFQNRDPLPESSHTKSASLREFLTREHRKRTRGARSPHDSQSELYTYSAGARRWCSHAVDHRARCTLEHDRVCGMNLSRRASCCSESSHSVPSDTSIQRSVTRHSDSGCSPNHRRLKLAAPLHADVQMAAELAWNASRQPAWLTERVYREEVRPRLVQFSAARVR